MIEQTQQHVKTKKSSKGGKKKVEQHKLVEQEVIEKILEQGKQMSELSQINQKEELKKNVQKLSQLLEDLVSYLLLDHEQFKTEIQSSLVTLKGMDLSQITHKHVIAYSLWAKIIFIEQKLESSSVKFNKHIVEKQKQKLSQNFKQGLRSIQNCKKYYKDQRVSS